MTASNRIALIRDRLTAALSPTLLDVIDDSHHHVGHPGAQGGGHFTVRLACPTFENKSRVACHRMIYEALGHLMQTDIHALSIEIISPSS